MPRVKRTHHHAAEIAALLEKLGPRFGASWAAWIEDRRARRKPLTEYAQVLQLRDCSRWGSEAAIAAIETSVKRGWIGLFEPYFAASKPAEPAQPRPPSASERERRRLDSHDQAVEDVLGAYKRGESFEWSVVADKYRDLGKNRQGMSVAESAQDVIAFVSGRKKNTTQEGNRG
jgi:hypothetical protein